MSLCRNIFITNMIALSGSERRYVVFGRSKEAKKSDVELFSIYDSKTGIYDLPSPAENQEDMIRAILNMFKSPEGRSHRYFLNAEDYALFKVGGFGKKSGELECHSPAHCANLHELRRLVEIDRAPGTRLNDLKQVEGVGSGIVAT